MVSKTVFISSEHLSIVFQTGGSDTSIQGCVFCFVFFFLTSGWREAQYLPICL